MAAQVTFIIGNGLDLSLELKTKYSDFYAYVIEKDHIGSNRIYKEISGNLDTWSDFERSLGEHTSYIGKLPESKREDESIKFHEELDRVRDDLADYLDSQEKSIENLPDKFQFAADEKGLFDGLNDGQYNIVRGILQSLPVYLNFVSLNYTKTLEKILAGDKILTPRGYNLQLPQHLHGTVDLYMTLGVSDESQLYDGMSTREKNDLIKSKLIDSANDGRLEAFRKTLRLSSVVVLFGASMGETDSYIWREIISWMNVSNSRYVIIHKYDTTYTARSRRSVRTENSFKEAVQERFLQYGRISKDIKEDLMRRVFVIHNTDKLFVPRK